MADPQGLAIEPTNVVIPNHLRNVDDWAIILLVYPEHNHAAMMAGWFMTCSETGAGALVMSIVNEACSFSNERRGLTMAG